MKFLSGSGSPMPINYGSTGSGTMLLIYATHTAAIWHREGKNYYPGSMCPSSHTSDKCLFFFPAHKKNTDKFFYIKILTMFTEFLSKEVADASQNVPNIVVFCPK